MMSASVYIAEVCRLFIIIVLVAAAWGKTNSFEKFRETLVDSFQVPKGLSKFSAFAIIISEWVIALIIFTNGEWASFGMVAALSLFVLFTIVIALALLQNKHINCNCFGRANQTISIYDIIRNIILIAACLYVLFYPTHGQSIDLISRLLLAGLSYIFFLISTGLSDIAFLAQYHDKGVD